MKKKALIILNNFEMGGIKKSVLSYLDKRAETDDVTLLMLSMQGTLLEWIPQNIRVVKTRSLYHYFGMNQRDCRSVKDKLMRIAMTGAARLFGTSFVQSIADLTIEDLGEFDEIVSYHHIARDGTIYGGTAEYALAYSKKHPAPTVCFIHCDYCMAIPDRTRSNKLYRKFSKIICVSKGTKKSFLKAFENESENVRREMAEKTEVVYNLVDHDMIERLAQESVPECMKTSPGDDRITLVSVARLYPEKGILRFVKILAGMDHSKLRYVIVGDGKEESAIRQVVSEAHMEDTVIFAGNQMNPYQYMKNADILVVPSYHEAAPVVFQEAEVLDLPVLSTNTLSAAEMVKKGWVVENDDEAIREKLREIIAQWKR